jgi:hypothetical protein
MMNAERALSFIEEHGVVLVSGRGTAARLVEAILGEEIRGSWWAHPRSREIFAVLQRLERSSDLALCRLVEGKVTFVHRRLWPALVRLQRRFDRKRLALIRQEHTAAGKHVNRPIAFSSWIPHSAREAARQLSESEAERLLGPVLMAATLRPQGTPPAQRRR